MKFTIDKKTTTFEDFMTFLSEIGVKTCRMRYLFLQEIYPYATKTSEEKIHLELVDSAVENFKDQPAHIGDFIIYFVDETNIKIYKREKK